MTNHLVVSYYDGTLVGELTRSGGRIAFRYADTWREAADATPLSVSMPLTAAAHPARVVERWLWGLLPDNEAVLRRWSREFHTSARQPMGLLAAVGNDLPGAFRMAPADAAPIDAAGVEWLSETQVADLLRQVRADHTAWLGANSEGRWSLAGAQAKTALLFEGDRWGRPHGRAATTHILKPAITGLDDHDLNEHLCLRAAHLLGLRAVRSSVVEFAGERAIVVERYDRQRVDGEVIRIHQEDMCQALSVAPDRKYEAEGGPTAADVARVLRAHVGGEVGASTLAAFADALAFNWIVGAPDAHAKNYGLLLSGSQVRFAPLYDVASVLPYPESYEPKLRLAMKIGGTYQASRIDAEHWRREAARVRIAPDAFVDRVHHLAEATPAAFAEACKADDVARLGSALPGRLLDAVAARARRCVNALR